MKPIYPPRLKETKYDIETRLELKGKVFDGDYVNAHVSVSAIIPHDDPDGYSIISASWDVWEFLGILIHREETDDLSEDFEDEGDLSDPEFVKGILYDVFKDTSHDAVDYAEQMEDEKQNEAATWDRIQEVVKAVEAVIGHPMREAFGGSHYGRFSVLDEAGDEIDTLKIRVSDHPQKPGGGFSQTTGERMGESDVQFVVSSPDYEIPSRDEILKRIQDAIEELGY